MLTMVQALLQRRGIFLLSLSRINNTRSRIGSTRISLLQQWRGAHVAMRSPSNIRADAAVSAAKVEGKDTLIKEKSEDHGIKWIHPSTRAENKTRPMAMWLSMNDKDIDESQVIKQLPVVSLETHPSLDTVIFLVTAKFAHLLEPGSNFLDTAVNSIWPVTFEKVTRSMQSIVAVVDALPAITYSAESSTMQASPQEGIAVCVSSRLRAQVDEQGGQSDAPLISLSTAYRTATKGYLWKQQQIDNSLAPSGLQAAFSYSAPVANTLFVNGRKHTMVRQDWQRIGMTLVSQPQVQHLAHIDLPIYDNDTQDYFPTKLNTKLEILTEPATIISSMGNILRQVADGGGKIISASQELEAVVPPLVKAKQESFPNAEVRVFALVYPKSSSTEGLNVSSDRNSGLVSAFKLHRVLGLDCGRLHRVTSGGAGWGKKAGLLSLDPITRLNQPAASESASSFFPGFEFDENEAEAGASLEDTLLPEGHLVQFFASWQIPNATRPDQGIDPTYIKTSTKAPTWTQRSYFNASTHQKLCLGTTSYDSFTTQQTQSSETFFYPNTFGFLTTSSISISTKSKKVAIGEREHRIATADAIHLIAGPDETIMHSTLIELPDTIFVGTAAAAGKKVAADKDSVIIHPAVADELLQIRKLREEKKKAQQKVDETTQMQQALEQASRSPLKSLQLMALEGQQQISVSEEPDQSPNSVDLITKYVPSTPDNEPTEEGSSDFPDPQKGIKGVRTENGTIRRVIAEVPPDLMPHIISRSRNQRQKRRLAKLKAGLHNLLIDENGSLNTEGLETFAVRSDRVIRKSFHVDPQMAAKYTPYRAEEKQEYQEYAEKQKLSMSPMREQRYAPIKAVKSKSDIFDRNRKQIQTEKSVVGDLMGDLEDMGDFEEGVSSNKDDKNR